jgi:protoheme IX farnesyltransferase
MLNYIKNKFTHYKHLTKFFVDIIVALTAIFGYVIGRGENTLDLKSMTALFLGGFLVTATAHIINQLIEKDLDAQMKRTQHRPLVTGTISKQEAVISGLLMSITGLLLLYFWVNPFAAFISFVSLIMYAFIYTPLKQIHRIAIWIGAIPGALPILIGYTGATGHIDTLAILLFTFQVLWQLPHFWAIAWLWNDEYQKAGYDLMPMSGGKTKRNAFLTFLSVWLLYPVLFLFWQQNLISLQILTMLVILTILFMVQAFFLYQKRNEQMAFRLMKASVIYLPIVQFILIYNFINL